MTATRTTRGLRILLTIVGLVMLGAGSLSVVFGASSVLGAGDVAADVDSEMRFYAVWYVVAGAFLLRATRRIESKAWAIRLIAAFDVTEPTICSSRCRTSLYGPVTLAERYAAGRYSRRRHAWSGEGRKAPHNVRAIPPTAINPSARRPLADENGTAVARPAPPTQQT